MQQLAGLLVEYLAIGAASALWILLLIFTYAGLPSDKDHPVAIVLLFPLTYVLGMVSDFLGELLVHNKKETIKNEARKGTVVESLRSQEIHAKIVVCSPELATELNSRSSRDRIARGVLVNVPFVGMATLLYIVHNVRRSCLLGGLGVVATLSMTWVIYLMWERFQKHSYEYEIFAYQVVDKKLKHSAPDGSALRP